MATLSQAISELQETYSLEDFKSILSHGCVSGAARSHIYYHETNDFYDKYEEAIVEYLEDTYGIDYLGTVLLQEADNLLRTYKNAVVWRFIELVSSEQIVDNEDYLKPESILEPVS